MKKSLVHLAISLFLLGLAYQLHAQDTKKPNILVIFGDDVGWYNLGVYNHGVMGYNTLNIDRIAHEGALFTDFYGQQSCTAGRAAFITGQSPIRTGLLRVGVPGSPLGLQKQDPTIAELLKPLGYMTFQFGKNHLGDRNEFLPTVHGFDEFSGNLYHLNAEEEPENVDYPKDPKFRAAFGPRGVLNCKATLTVSSDPADARFGAWGKQTCTDTGPLTKKRMETVDEEFLSSTLDAIERSVKAGKPFFIWHNTTRMHAWTHLQPKYEAMIPELGLYGAGMQELDDQVGAILKKLDDLGIANNTIVMFTSDNGAPMSTWPDGATTPFRGQKNTDWEGGFRVPAVVRWPGVIKPGTVVNKICAMEDWLPTLLAAAGNPDIKEQLLKGTNAGGVNYKVHLDGYNWIPYFTGQTKEAPRKEFLYFTDTGELAALRYGKWKLVFLEQRAEGQLVWSEPFVALRIPLLFDLRADPFERAQHEANIYDTWALDRMYVMMPSQAFLESWIKSFAEFPPRQKATKAISVDQAIDAIAAAGGSAN
jgi:arylsulfatase